MILSVIIYLNPAPFGATITFLWKIICKRSFRNIAIQGRTYNHLLRINPTWYSILKVIITVNPDFTRASEMMSVIGTSYSNTAVVCVT